MTRELTPYPLTFEPQLLVKVWGGSKLVDLYDKPPGDGPLGESWEVSAVPGRESVVDAGPYQGEALGSLVREFGGSLLGEKVFQKYQGEFPLLLKLIDAADDLSVQVHPNADDAERLGGGARSKSEAWLILHAEPGARLVHGVKEKIEREAFAELIREGRVEQSLDFIEVKPGDVVPVEPRTIHAIGKGVVLLELQESSDTTYRVYDYNRPGLDGKPRQLHVKEALEVADLEPKRSKATPEPLPGPARRELLYRSPPLEMQRWTVDEPLELRADPERFWLLTVLEGRTALRSDSPVPEVPLTKGRSVLIPASFSAAVHPKGEVTLFLGSVSF